MKEDAQADKAESVTARNPLVSFVLLLAVLVLALYFGKPLLENLSAGIKAPEPAGNPVTEQDVAAVDDVFKTNAPQLSSWTPLLSQRISELEGGVDISLHYAGVREDGAVAVIDYQLEQDGQKLSKELFLERDEFGRYYLSREIGQPVDKFYPPQGSDPLKP